MSGESTRETGAGGELERLRGENELLRVRAAAADSGRDVLLRVIARVRQMADAWERTLPEVIRTEVAASAIREATISIFEERT